MIKLTVKASVPDAYKLIDDRLPLFLSSQNLRGSHPGFLDISKDSIIQTVDNTIYYFEKQPNRGSLLLVTSTRHRGKPKATRYGMALRSATDDRLEIYTDIYNRAINRGILRKPEPVLSKKVTRVLLAALACFLIIAMAALVAPFVFAIIVTVLCYPFIWLRAKKQFRREQEDMHTILSLFESEFPVIDKQDTKDSITFFARVRSAATDIFIS